MEPIEYYDKSMRCAGRLFLGIILVILTYGCGKGFLEKKSRVEQ